MAQWGNKDAANNAPKYVTDATTGKTGIQEYNDTVFGQAPAEVADGAGSPGWVRSVKGEGRVTGIEVVSGGADYVDGDLIEVGSTMGTLGVVNGEVVSVDITLPDTLIDELPVIEVTSDAGAGAEFQLITEGRLGRVSVETLVAMRGIS